MCMYTYICIYIYIYIYIYAHAAAEALHDADRQPAQVLPAQGGDYIMVIEYRYPL